MSQEDMLTKEQAAAWKWAGMATAATVAELPKFSGWLMTGLGGALTIFVTNYAAVSELIDAPHLRIALLLFTCSMLFGLAAQWLAIPVRTALALSQEALELRKQGVASEEFVNLFASLLIPPYRYLFKWRLASAKNIDAISAIRSPARLSQILAILVMLQYLYAVSVVFALALGV